MKIGRVVIVGRPNTGKSSLLNSLIGNKIAITSPLPQTTRKSKRVVFEDERGKLILSDTPGLIDRVRDMIAKRVNLEIPKELNKADLIIALFDISRPKNEEDNKIVGLIRKLKTKKILVYNKIDKAIGSKDHLAEYNYLEEEFDKCISISAINSTNIKGLIGLIFDLLPKRILKKNEKYAQELSDNKIMNFGKNAKEYVSEIIREKVYLFLREELPYSINIEVEEIKDKKSLIFIKAKILTSIERYKKMIIGRNGKKIKEIGFNARKELELATSRKIYLELEVVVDKHWVERVFNT